MFSTLPGADACYGDESDVYRGMSCTEVIETYSSATFCNYPNYFEDECCVTWPLTCNGKNRAIRDK